MPPSSTLRLRGADHPRVEVARPAVDREDGDLAVKLAAAAGLPLEPWQAAGLRTMLGRLEHNGPWSAFEYVEVCSRQNGKTAQLLARALAGMFLLNEQIVLWTAHEVKTSMRAWRDLRRLLRTLGTQVNDNLIHVNGIPVKVNASNGSEGFERLDTGQEIRIVARSKGSGRGFSVDCLIVDEAFAYEETHQDALMPMLIARPNPQVCYASSPPLDGLSGGPMFALRRRALAGGDETLAYRDWGLDGDLDDLLQLSAVDRDAILDDRARWQRANPALGRGRVSEDSILRLRRSMTERGFAREVLGLWPRQIVAGQGWQVIREEPWRRRGAAAGRPGSPVCFAVSAAWPDAERATIAVAGLNQAGETVVQVVDHRDGTSWVPARLVELEQRWSPESIVLDRKGPAGRLIPDVEAEDVELTHPSMDEVALAAAEFYTAVAGDSPTVRHMDQPELDAAVAAAAKRPLGDRWTWQRQGPTDISPLEAVTLAAWAVAREKNRAEPWLAWR